MAKIYFFLKSYFGFSKRESKGFVLVVPALIVLYLIPSGYDWLVRKKNEEKFLAYSIKIDSLVMAGWKPYQSNFQNQLNDLKSDTVKRANTYQKPKSPQLNKMSFSDADSVVLQIVPGIGQTMAGRVVKFRENMGGLYSKDQLLEVYGMTPEVLEKVFEYFEFVPEIKNKILINQADVNDLAKHPYINYGSAKVMIAFREQHGPYQSADDLLKIKIFNQEWVDRLKPYLEF
ncbi:ComEA family DNA-binding protein [Aquiflexum gelatinilyticum]|uniref:Helix-hairpin-helix domain-containing protein n=1 Tax=Aquiflexum gelatinilyticum TaxID=2961943 RepID=A0A9X2PEW1_9BACT|nr:helix-hairpin-helix domain-containing protein [Aquiflexum gelatinilyticum]MCR9017455.1 helix-hairpin-helix domain-containing protein [Aquiflexum gelatinilyticum]